MVSPFQCSSASRKFLKVDAPRRSLPAARFQCSSASRKFLKDDCHTHTLPHARVSVLFSEPKIPQMIAYHHYTRDKLRFSALQRAENSSKKPRSATRACSPSFQCSSASRKFLKPTSPICAASAARFQCSSASRKFLKAALRAERRHQALFQCSSASRKFLKRAGDDRRRRYHSVSVLFSEPKIPQTSGTAAHLVVRQRFSALQRAENSSNAGLFAPLPDAIEFQCSSASRKFLKRSAL